MVHDFIYTDHVIASCNDLAIVYTAAEAMVFAMKNGQIEHAKESASAHLR